MKLGTAILVLGMVACRVDMAQSAGTFTTTGALITSRANHKATLLPNGKVLITGGYGPTGFSPALASAELFDPFAGTFTATGNMTTARVGHTATLLPDGRVLVAGGSADPSAEVYDPSTGTFTATSAMVSRPYSWLESATLLQDGTVFIAGQTTAQIYDPATDTFAATSPYAAPAPTFIGRATLLTDGRVLLTRGTDVAGWAELYEPNSGRFSIAGNMNSWDDVNTATLVADGRVLFVGSVDGGWPADAEIFDPSDGAFTSIGNSSASHEYAAAALLPDGTVLITGGQLAGNGEAISEIYTPASGTFSATGNMVIPRHEHTATLLPDGTVLIACGYSLWPYSDGSAELFHPAVLAPAPLLFSLSGDGKGQGAIWRFATGQAASPEVPASAGEILAMYTTSMTDGSVIPPQVAIGGRLAEILFFGNAPGYPGFNQVNVRVPERVPAGSAVPVRLSSLGRWSNEVTIGVR